MGMDLRVPAMQRADEEFWIFERSCGSEKVDDEVDDRLVSGKKGVLEHFEIVKRVLLLDRMAEIEIKIGPFDLDIEDVDQIRLELGRARGGPRFCRPKSGLFREGRYLS